MRQNPDEITLILQARREDELEDNDTNINEDESQHSDDDYDGSDDESQVDSYSEEISSADINSYSGNWILFVVKEILVLFKNLIVHYHSFDWVAILVLLYSTKHLHLITSYLLKIN